MIVVYTALFGNKNRDRLYPPPKGSQARFVCFTDALGRSPHGWDVVHLVKDPAKPPAMMTRLFKVRPDHWFPEAEATLWMDAAFELLMIPEEICAACPGPLWGFHHSVRRTLEDEAKRVIKRNLAPKTAVNRQMQCYWRRGFHPKVPRELTTGGFLLRRPEAACFNRTWEDQLAMHTLRDQLGLDYSAWATRTPVSHFDGLYTDNPFAVYHAHQELKGF